jgi:hypothetical protein
VADTRRANPLVLPLMTAGALLLLAPILLLRQWEIRRRPVVTASASGHHVVVARRKGSPRVVVATVEFDRPSRDGEPAHCRVENFEVGAPSDPKAFSPTLQLAVRTDSCYDAKRIP